MERWKTVESEIAEFHRYLCADFPRLQVREGYDYAWDDFEWSCGPQYKESRKDKRYGDCGVYLLYDEMGNLLYVGMARDTFDNAVWDHLNQKKDKRYIPGTRFIDLIPIPKRFGFFCCALVVCPIRLY